VWSLRSGGPTDDARVRRTTAACSGKKIAVRGAMKSQSGATKVVGGRDDDGGGSDDGRRRTSEGGEGYADEGGWRLCGDGGRAGNPPGVWPLPSEPG